MIEIGQLFADRFVDGLVWSGVATIMGFGTGLAINLFKHFGGIR